MYSVTLPAGTIHCAIFCTNCTALFNFKSWQYEITKVWGSFEHLSIFLKINKFMITITNIMRIPSTLSV